MSIHLIGHKRNQEKIRRKNNQQICHIFCPLSHRLLQLLFVWPSSINSLQRVQNNAARLVLEKKKTDHVFHELVSFSYLFPTESNIKKKQQKITLILVHKCLNNLSPHYLQNHFSIYTPTRCIRFSSDTCYLNIPRFNLTTMGFRSFSVFGPYTWNMLPLS